MLCALGLQRRIRPLTRRDGGDGVLHAEAALESGEHERRPFRGFHSRHPAELTHVQRRHLATSLPATSAVAAICRPCQLWRNAAVVRANRYDSGSATTSE